MDEFTDEEVFGGGGGSQQAPRVELSDADVFGAAVKPKVLSDADVGLGPRPGLTDYPVAFGKRVLGGAGETFASEIKGASNIVAQGMTPQGQFSMIEASTGMPSFQAPPEPTPVPDPTTTGTYQLGKTVSDVAQKVGQENVLHPVVRDVAQGFGSVAANIAPAMIPGIGLPLTVAGAPLQGIGESLDRAIQAGATTEQRVRAGNLGTIAGMTEFADVLLPTLGGTGKALGLIKRVGLRALEGMFIEGGQEGLQEGIQNAIAKGVYNPKQDIWTPDVPYNAFIGAVVGGATSAALGGHKEGQQTGEATDQSVEASLRALQGTPLPAGAAPVVEARIVQPSVGQTPVAPVQAPVEPPVGSPPPAAVVPAPVAPAKPDVNAPAPVAPPPVATPDQFPFPSGAMFSSYTGINSDGQRVFQRSNGFRQIEREDGTIDDEVQDYMKPRLPQFRIDADISDLPTNNEIAITGFQDGQRVQSPVGAVPVETSSEPELVYVPESTRVQALPNDVSFYPAQKMIATTVTGEPFYVTSHHSAFLSDWLKDLKPNPGSTDINSFINTLIAQKLQQLVPDIMVHVVSPQDMARTNPGNMPLLGAYLVPNNKSIPHSILINGNDIAADPSSIPHVILHEGTHAATSRIMDADPVLREQIRLLMQESLVQLNNEQYKYNSVKYAFTNEKEFIAEVFSHPQLQHVLSNIRISPELAKKLGITGPKPTLWQAFVQLVQRILGMPQTLEVYSMLEAALRVGSRVIDAQARMPGDRARPQSTNEMITIDAQTSQAVQNTNPVDVSVRSSPQDVLSWFYNTFLQAKTIKGTASVGSEKVVNFEEIVAITGKTPEEIGQLLQVLQSLPNLVIEGHYLWLARNTRSGTSHMRIQLGNREYTGIKFLSGPERRQANMGIVAGLRENWNALSSESKDMTAVGFQPETVGIRASVDHLFGMGKKPVPPAVKAAGAHADHMNWLYKWMAGLDQVARANPFFEPLLRYVETIRSMHVEETQLHDAAVRIGKDWLSLGHRGERMASFIDELMHMDYRNDVEVRNGVVRHPTAAEFNRLSAKHQMDAGMHETFRKITTMLVGVNGQGGYLGLLEQSIISKIQRTVQSPTIAAARIAGVQRQVQELRGRPYFPFTNFGRNYILVRDPAGKLIHFETVERSGLKSAQRMQNSRANELSRLWEQDYGSVPVSQKDVITGILPEHVSPMIGQPAILLQEMSDVMFMTPEQINSSNWLQVAQVAGAAPMLNPRYQKKFYSPGYGADVSGYSMDLRRSFARFFFHGAKFYTKTKYLDQLKELVRTAELTPGNKQGQVSAYMRDHLQNTVIDAKGDFGWFKGAIFFWAMGYVPAAATQNLSQTPMITLPFLSAKFGEHKAIPAMVKAMGRVSSFYKRGTYDQMTDFESKAFSYGIKTGRITETQAPEIAGMSQNSLLQGVGGNVTQRNWQRFMQGAAWMFETMEQVNRRVAYRAALDLATKNPKAKFIDEAISFHKEEYAELRANGFSEAQARAIVAAVNVVEQTQYTYARWARPRFMRGSLAGTLFVFKKYIQSTLFMLGQNPDVFWRYALIAMFVGGLNGLPGMEDLLSIIKAVGRWYGGRDWNVEHEARRFITDFFDGTVEPDMVLHGFARRGLGIPALLDMIGSFATGTPGRGLAAPKHVRDPQTGDIRPEGFAKNVPFPVLDRSRALGMGLIAPFDVGKLATPTQDLNKNIAEQTQKASGAVFSVGFNIYKAVMDNHLAFSDWKRWERAVPRLLGDASQSFRAFSEGRERSKGGPAGGSTIVNFDTRDTEQMMEILAIGMGYQPLRLQARWDSIMAKMEVEKYYDLQRNGLLEDLYEARKGQSQQEIERTVNAIKRFNAELPDWAKARAITRDTASRSLQARERAVQSRESGVPSARTNVPIAREIDRLYPEATVDVRRVR